MFWIALPTPSYHRRGHCCTCLLMASGSSLAAQAPSARNGYEGAAELPIVASYPLANPTVQARDVRARDGRAYLVLSPFYSDPNYVYLLDVTDPHSPALISAVSGIARDPDEIWLQGDRAFVAKKGNGVDIMDISNPALVPTPGIFSGRRRPPIAKGLHAWATASISPTSATGCRSWMPPITVRRCCWAAMTSRVRRGRMVLMDRCLWAADRDGENHPVVYALDVSNPAQPSSCIC